MVSDKWIFLQRVSSSYRSLSYTASFSLLNINSQVFHCSRDQLSFWAPDPGSVKVIKPAAACLAKLLS